MHTRRKGRMFYSNGMYRCKLHLQLRLTEIWGQTQGGQLLPWGLIEYLLIQFRTVTSDDYREWSCIVIASPSAADKGKTASRRSDRLNTTLLLQNGLTSQSISLVTIPPSSGRSLCCSVSLSPSLYVAISCWVVASRWMCWTRLTTVASGWNDYGRMGFDAGDGMGLNDSLPGIERKTTQSTLEGSWEVEYSDARNRYRSPELRSISHLSMMNLLCFLKSSCLQLSFH